MVKNFMEDSKVFKAFGDENRLRIIEMLNSGEKCACVLLEELEITQPTLSHHMKILVETGLIHGRKDGKWMHYSLSADEADRIKEKLNGYVERKPEQENKEVDDKCKG